MAREITRPPGKNALFGYQLTQGIAEVIVQIHIRRVNFGIGGLSRFDFQTVIRNAGVHQLLRVDSALAGDIHPVDDCVRQEDAVVFPAVNGIRSSGHCEEHRCGQQYFLSGRRTALGR